MMRTLQIAYVLSLALCIPPALPEDPEWEAYLNELNNIDLNISTTVNPASIKPSLPNWFDGPMTYFEAIYGSGMGRFPDRPTWEARRRITREMESRKLIERKYGFERRRASDAAIDYLLGASRHEQWTVRAVATFVLGDVPYSGDRPETLPQVLSAILRNTKDDHAVVRAFAAYATGMLLKDAKEGRDTAAKALYPLLQDAEPFARHTAACTLSIIGKADASAIEVLRRDLHRADWWIIAGAVASLYRIGAPAKSLVPDLLPLLHHEVSTVRRNTYITLEILDPKVLVGNPDAARAVKDLREMLPQLETLPK